MSRHWLGLLLVVMWIGGSGVAAAANPTLSATNVSLGTVPVGLSGTADTTLSISSGSGSLTVATFDVTAAGCSEFQVIATLPLTVSAPNTNGTATVTLSPTSAGNKNCTIAAKDSLGATLASFTASGTAVTPQTISVSPSPANFGSVRVDTAAVLTATQVFTLSNTGGTGTTLHISGITFSDPDYSLQPLPTFPIAISQGTPQTITVQFDPSSAGTHDATMAVASDDPATPNKTVSLTGVGTTAVIAVTDVNFNTVNDGTTSTLNIAITNSATNSRGVLTVNSATITGGSFFSFGVGQGCNGGTSCTFTQPFTVTTGTLNVPVRCQPPAAATGTQTATVTFVSDSDPGGDAIAQLTCTAGRPNIAVTTNTLAFGNVVVGSTSPAQTVTIQNTGNTTLSYSLSKNPNVAQYAITGCTINCTIAANSMTTFSVTFAPTAIGILTTRIDITNNDPDPGDSPFSINVSGTGTAPQISVAPTSLTFANTEVGRTSTAQTVTATNTGNSSLTISSATFQTGAGDYIVTAGQTGSQTIAPNATASWDIACKPSAQGARAGTFRIASNSLNGAPTDVTLSCTGEQGIIATNPASLNFGGVVAGTTKTLPFTLQNTGNVPLTGITGTLNNTTIGYQFNPATVPNTLAAGASVALAVTFAPLSGTDGGPATITFTAGWGNFGSTTTATLSIDGKELSPGYDITPAATFDFGDFRFDTKPQITYHIVNTGQNSVTILTQVFTPDAGTTASEIGIVIRKAGALVTLPQTLAIGEQLDVTVTAQPNNRIGLIGGHIDIHSDLVATATVMPDRRVTLTGTSSTAAISVPGLVDFGPVDVDGPAPTQTVTLTNNGMATLDIGSITTMTGASPAFTVTLPAGVTHVVPGDNLSLTITYKPTVERPPNQFDTAVLVANNLAGIFGGPAQAMITIQGRGIDRHITIDPVQDFPVTAVGLESRESTQAITVHNTGEATLSITALMVGGDPVWELVDPSPVDIPGNGSHDFLVKFVPADAGSFTGELTLMNNDNGQPMAMVTLSGSAVFAHVHGSGGCDAGGPGWSGGWALAFGVLVAGRVLRRWRRRRARLDIATIATVVTVAVAPRASADGIGVTVFEPTPATTGISFQLQSPEVGENGSWVASSVLSYASHPLVIDLFDSGGMLVNHEALIERSSLLQVGGAYAFLDRFEAGAHMPFYMQSGQPVDPSKGFTVPPARGTATGNLTLHAKARLWRGESGLGTVVAGTGLTVVIPTATKDQFTGSDKPAAQLLLLGSFTPAAMRSRLTISANAGGILRAKAVYADMVQQSGVAWGAGMSFRILDPLWTTAEVFGELTPSGQRAQGGAMPSATVLSQIEWLAGLSYKIDRRFTIGLAAGRGVTDGPGTPDLRGVLSLAFVPHAAPVAPIHPIEPTRPDVDSDGDGIIDRLDRCPHEPEDKDGFQDADGCPDPDNDHDGIPDALDKCPNEAEDKDGFQDADGCPDPDNDGDGIPDVRDKCPNEPETINGKEDADGCPDTVDAPSTAVPDQGSPTKAAEATFARGRELMKQGNYAAACAEFEQSQRLDPQFGTQYNLAGCYEKTGKLATAWNLYRELARSDTNPPRRAKAAGLAGSLARRVPKLKLVLPKKPEGVQVSMNGASANALIGIETPVDLGSYALVVGATGYRAWRKTVEITEESKVVTVVIDLEPVH